MRELSEKEIVRRKIQLKTQALKLIRAERDQLSHLENLIKLRAHLQRQIGDKFDPSLSQQLDAVQYLVEALSPRILIPGEPNEFN